MKHDFLSRWSEASPQRFVGRPAIVFRVYKVVDDLNIATGAESGAGRVAQIIRDRSDCVRLFDSKLGDRQERRVAANQRDVRPVQRVTQSVTIGLTL